MNKGFSLIEILGVISIIAILTFITLNYNRSFKEGRVLEGISSALTADLDQVKADAQAGKNNLEQGIKFASSTYTIFEGATFDEEDSNNIEKTIDDNFSISTTLNNDLIYFSKVSGDPNNNGDIIITSINDENLFITLTIGKLGNVSVIE